MNSEQDIYKEFGDNICLQPFFGAFYQTVNIVDNGQSKNNSVRPCCFIDAPPGKWDVENGSIIQSRNNSSWKQLRQKFIDGEYDSIPECSSCQNNEKLGIISARQRIVKYLCDVLDVDIVKEMKSIVNNNTVDDIITLDYFPSNYCNLSCVMCFGGSSSSRHVFELRFRNRKTKILLNDNDDDFLQSLKKLQIMNFTGGETIIQPQVLEVIDYLITHNLSKNITIKLLTNLTTGPEALEKILKNFKSINVTISIDGTKDIIEYQRRGCKWDTIEQNSKQYFASKKIGVVVNYVLTAINVLNFVEFVDWIYQTDFGPTQSDHLKNTYVIVTPVDNADHLGLGAVPNEIRSVAIKKLTHAKQTYSNINTVKSNYYSGLIQQVLDLVQTTPYDLTLTHQFIQHIKHEDRASLVSFYKLVPEWEPYFSLGRF